MVKEKEAFKEEKCKFKIEMQTNELIIREKEKNSQNISEKLKTLIALNEDKDFEISKLRREIKAFQVSVAVHNKNEEKCKHLENELNISHSVILKSGLDKEMLCREIQFLKEDLAKKSDYYASKLKNFEILRNRLIKTYKKEFETDLKTFFKDDKTKRTLEERKENNDEENHFSVEDIFQARLNELKKQNEVLIRKFEDYNEIMITLKHIIFEIF